MDFMMRQDLTEYIDPLGTVVVAGYEHDFPMRKGCAELSNEAIKKSNGFSRRDGLVVNIPGNNDSIRLTADSCFHYLLQDVFLVFLKVMVDKFQADMQIREMEKFHNRASLTVIFCIAIIIL